MKSPNEDFSHLISALMSSWAQAKDPVLKMDSSVATLPQNDKNTKWKAYEHIDLIFLKFIRCVKELSV